MDFYIVGTEHCRQQKDPRLKAKLQLIVEKTRVVLNCSLTVRLPQSPSLRTWREVGEALASSFPHEAQKKAFASATIRFGIPNQDPSVSQS